MVGIFVVVLDVKNDFSVFDLKESQNALKFPLNIIVWDESVQFFFASSFSSSFACNDAFVIILLNESRIRMKYYSVSNYSF